MPSARRKGATRRTVSSGQYVLCVPRRNAFAPSAVATTSRTSDTPSIDPIADDQRIGHRRVYFWLGVRGEECVQLLLIGRGQILQGVCLQHGQRNNEHRLPIGSPASPSQTNQPTIYPNHECMINAADICWCPSRHFRNPLCLLVKPRVIRRSCYSGKLASRNAASIISNRWLCVKETRERHSVMRNVGIRCSKAAAVACISSARPNRHNAVIRIRYAISGFQSSVSALLAICAAAS